MMNPTPYPSSPHIPPPPPTPPQPRHLQREPSHHRTNTAWQNLINLDLSLIHQLLRFMHDENHAKFKYIIDNITSDNPLQDINLVQWIVFFSALLTTTRWVTLLWSCTVNLIMCTTLRFFIGAPRPFEIDTRLKATAHRGRSNYGFPSTETHMSIVLNGCIIVYEDGIDKIVPFFLFILTLVIGFTRVYSCSRFVHQIVLSYFTGSIGLIATIQLTERWKEWDVNWRLHMLWLSVIVGVFFVCTMLSVEDNSSYLGGVPKEEYVRVIQGIVNTDPAKISEHIAMQNSKVLDYQGNDPNERQRRMKTAWRLQNRKDSFYFLHNTIIKNQQQKNEMARQQRDSLIAEQQRRQYLEERNRMRQRTERSSGDMEFTNNLR